MTYTEYLAKSQRLQRKYIEDEFARIHKADALFFAYKSQMANLGLHPLTREEIRARRDELRIMLARVEETHGDTPVQRALYRSRSTVT